MAEKDQPPAPPAGSPPSAPEAPRAVAKPIEEKRPKVYDTLKDHLAESNHPEAKTSHPRVHEHAELHGMKQVLERDAVTGEMVLKPDWRIRVLLAWWKAHGLEHHSRISPDHFQAALHEALNGRI